MLPADPGGDRTGPEAFPRLAEAPIPPPPPHAPLPDFQNFAKNSPHEFSCPADPRWRRIHRGGCWEQDLYPLTPTVTPVVPVSLKAAAKVGTMIAGGTGLRRSRPLHTRSGRGERGTSLPHLALFGLHRVSRRHREACSFSGVVVASGASDGRHSFPAAPGLLRTGHWPWDRGGPQGPGAGNGEVASVSPPRGRGACLCLCSYGCPTPHPLRLPECPPSGCPETELIAVPCSSQPPRPPVLVGALQGLAAGHHHLLSSECPSAETVGLSTHRLYFSKKFWWAGAFGGAGF